jgi:hypothetical protein
MASDGLKKLINDVDKLFKGGEYKKILDSIITYLPNQNNKITGICNFDDFIFMIKIYTAGSLVCNSDRINGQESAYVESEILKILNNEFSDATPCIPMYIYSYKMPESDVKKNIKSIKDCIDTEDKMCVIWDGLNSGIMTGEPTFILMEAGQINFIDFCKKASTHVDVWIIKSIIWMVIYTIMIIRKKYPKFKHGDLYARNIVLYMDADFIEADQLGRGYYLKIDDYNIPYIGIIPKIIDYELSMLDDKLYANYKLQIDTDDILQLLFDIKMLWTLENQITSFVDKLLGVDIGFNKNYIQVSNIIERHGGIPSLESMLNSKVFNYNKSNIDKDQIWGTWK